MPDVSSSVAGLPVDDLAPLTGDAPITPVQQPAKPAPTAQPTTAPVQVDWSKIDPASIPENIIKATPQFKEVLSESVERRQAIKALKEQVGLVDAPKTDKPATPTQPDDMPAWAKQMMERVEKAEKAALEGGRKTLINQALETHNLPAEAARWITGGTLEEITSQAAELAKTFMTPGVGGSSGDGGQPATQQDRLRTAILTRVKGQAGPIDPVEGSLFNPKIQDRVTSR